jgi:hypothetical protein
MFAMADPHGTNKVSKQGGIEFFTKSGLDSNNLAQIWELAGQTDPSFLEKEEFYVALRLIAYYQNGQDISLQNIKINIAVALPKLDLSTKLRAPEPELDYTTAQIPQPQPSHQTMGSMQGMPMMGGMPLAPSMQNTQQQPLSVPQQQLQIPPFVISEEEKKKYFKIFDDNDTQRRGYLDATQTKSVFGRTKQSQETLFHVWNIVDEHDKGAFDRNMFAMAMHLLLKKIKGVPLPDALPPEMKASMMGIYPPGYQSSTPSSSQTTTPTPQQKYANMPPSSSASMGMPPQQMKNQPMPNQQPQQPQQLQLQPGIMPPMTMASEPPKEEPNILPQGFEQYLPPHGKNLKTEVFQKSLNTYSKPQEIAPQNRGPSDSSTNQNALQVVYQKDNEALQSMKNQTTKIEHSLNQINNDYGSLHSKVMEQKALLAKEQQKLETLLAEYNKKVGMYVQETGSVILN